MTAATREPETVLARYPVVFRSADPPRTGDLAWWAAPGRSIDVTSGSAAELVVAGPAGETVVVRTAAARVLPLAAAIPVLLEAGRHPQADPAVRFWAAATTMALDVVSRGSVLPGVSPAGFDAWRAGPLTADDIVRLRALAAAMPASARAVPQQVAPEPRLADAFDLVRAYLDAVADTLTRTPAGPWLAAHPAFVSAAPQLVPQWRGWAAEVGAGIDLGVGLDLRIEVSLADPEKPTLLAGVQLRNLADPTMTTTAGQLWREVPEGFTEQSRIDTGLAVRRAARVWPALARLLDQAIPAELDLLDDDVEELLAGAADRLADAGVGVSWPDGLSRELDARIRLSDGPDRPGDLGGWLAGPDRVGRSWQLTVAGEPLTARETDTVAVAPRPLVRLRDRWLLVEPVQAQRARRPHLPDLPPAVALEQVLVGGSTVDAQWFAVVADGWLAALKDLIAEPAAGPEPLDQPAALTATLRDYQRRGLRWMHRMTALGLGVCLADDMGLGKTVMLIALHLRRQEDPATAGPTLVICPASLLSNWEREIRQFAPGAPVRRYHGGRRSIDDLAGGFVLTTYATMRVDTGALAGRRWPLLVADEAQQVKNRLSGTAKAIRSLPAGVRIALTGTPVENNLLELWAILDWATPGLLGTAPRFRTAWVGSVEADRDAASATRLARLVRPFLLRRRKSDPGIAPELPPKTITDHLVSLSPEQGALYQETVDRLLSEIRRGGPGIARRGLILKLLTALKQICNHPASYRKESAPQLAGRSGKLDLLDDLLETIVAEDGAALVFTQYVTMARLLEGHLRARGVATLLLHGGVPIPRRDQFVAQFQSGAVPVFLLSLKAAGTGLNLTRADHVIHFDRWWNPAVEDQATDRAYRIGQDRPVQVHRLISENTLEERIATLLERKRELTDAVLHGGEGALSELSDADLADLVQLREPHE